MFHRKEICSGGKEIFIRVDEMLLFARSKRGTNIYSVRNVHIPVSFPLHIFGDTHVKHVRDGILELETFYKALYLSSIRSDR